MADVYYARAATDQLASLFRTFSAVAVVGARQVGKSTLLRHLFEGKADFVVFDPLVDVENARRDPELFLDNHRIPLVLDEIQYAPQVLSSLKRRIDDNRQAGQYLFSGSQQWGVMKLLAESLAGRVVFLDLDGFSQAEAGQFSQSTPWLRGWLTSPAAQIEKKGARFPFLRTLYERLWRGALPEAHFLPLEHIPDFQLAYQRTYIERDARVLADIRDWQEFSRFLRLAASLTAQEVNCSHLGREIGITPQTSQRWLDVLRDTFQWFEVPAYSGNPRKRVSGKPKGYIADTGVACHALAISAPAAIASHPAWGAIFETAVYGEVRKATLLMAPRPYFYHWRTHGGAEVDLILEWNGSFYPMEIKATSRPSRQDTTGITAFRKTYPGLRIEKGLVLSPCEQFQQISEEDYAVPWEALAG